jgi:Bacterial Ig domain
VTAPTHGQLVINADGTFSYLAEANYNGADQFTYRVNDGKVNSNIAVVNLTITPVDDPVVLSNQQFSMQEGTELSASWLNAANNVDGDPLTVKAIAQPKYGTLVLNADGSFSYTPRAKFAGLDKFTYVVNDGTGNSNTATVNITIKPNAKVQHAPVVRNLKLKAEQNQVVQGSVMAVANDADGDALTAQLVTGPSEGRLTFNSDGTFSYTPAEGFTGVVKFTFRVHDGKKRSNMATVFITLEAPAQAAAPTSVPAAAQTPVSAQAKQQSLVFNAAPATLSANSTKTEEESVYLLNKKQLSYLTARKKTKTSASPVVIGSTVNLSTWDHLKPLSELEKVGLSGLQTADPATKASETALSDLPVPKSIGQMLNA